VAVGGRGSPLLLLHGYPQSGEIWRVVAPALGQHNRVIIPDLPGMGLSDTAAGPHRLTSAAADIGALLDVLGAPQVSVVGHDWGGAVAATLALSQRSRVDRLVFIESAVAGAGFEQIWRFDSPNPKLAFIPFLLMEGVAEALVAGREGIFLHHLWDSFTSDKVNAPFEAWAPYIEAIRQPGRFTAGAQYYRAVYRSAEDTRQLLTQGKLSIPVLPIAGEQGIGPANETMAQNFASQVRPGLVLPRTGHFVAEERPDALLDALRSFLI
jgi:pimeloyl-ACP methyl ester carboxylesterase